MTIDETEERKDHCQHMEIAIYLLYTAQPAKWLGFYIATGQDWKGDHAKRAAQERTHRFLSFVELMANQGLQLHYALEAVPLQWQATMKKRTNHQNKPKTNKKPNPNQQCVIHILMLNLFFWDYSQFVFYNLISGFWHISTAAAICMQITRIYASYSMKVRKIGESFRLFSPY